MTELLPCPFCGGEAHTQAQQGNNARAFTFDVIHHCVFGFIRLAHKGPAWTEEEAVKAWNTRIPDTAQDWKTDVPLTGDFIEAVKDEMTHQQKRWGPEHDDQKSFTDWIALGVRLLGKAVDAYWAGDTEKQKHHVITLAAVMGNCYARLAKAKGQTP